MTLRATMPAQMEVERGWAAEGLTGSDDNSEGLIEVIQEEEVER